MRRPTNTRMPSALLPASVSFSTSPLRTVTEKSVPSATTSTSAASRRRAPSPWPEVRGEIAVVHALRRSFCHGTLAAVWPHTTAAPRTRTSTAAASPATRRASRRSSSRRCGSASATTACAPSALCSWSLRPRGGLGLRHREGRRYLRSLHRRGLPDGVAWRLAGRSISRRRTGRSVGGDPHCARSFLDGRSRTPSFSSPG